MVRKAFNAFESMHSFLIFNLAEGPELEQRFQNTPTSTSMWARIGPSLALYGFENAAPTRSPECGQYPQRMGSMEG
jgi:hypothetical protein